MEPSLAPDVEQLLHDLQPEQPLNVREAAVTQLAGLSVSNLQVVSALIAALESDPAFLIRQKAQAALAAPAHQAILEQHPALKERTTAPVARPRQSEPSLAAPPAADEIPEDVLQAQLRQKRFQALTPLFGMIAVGACMGFPFLVAARNMTLKELLIAAPFIILFVLGLWAVYKQRLRQLARWEEEIKDRWRG